MTILDSKYTRRKGKRQRAENLYVVHWTAESRKSDIMRSLRLYAKGWWGNPLYHRGVDRYGQRWRIAEDRIKCDHAGRIDLRVYRNAINGNPDKPLTGRRKVGNRNNRMIACSAMIPGSVSSFTLKVYRGMVEDAAEWCEERGMPSSRVVSHDELAHWRKVDIGSVVNMQVFRQDVNRVIATGELPWIVPVWVGADISQGQPMLRRGISSNWVVRLRQMLIRCGYTGLKTGNPRKFGKALDRAVRKFQKDQRLAVDGIVGPNTWRALTRSTYQSSLNKPELRRVK